MDSGEVVAKRRIGAKPPKNKAKIDEKLVSLLANVFTAATKGEIVAVALVATAAPGGVTKVITHTSDDNRLLHMLGEVRIMETVLIDRILNLSTNTKE